MLLKLLLARQGSQKHIFLVQKKNKLSTTLNLVSYQDYQYADT